MPPRSPKLNGHVHTYREFYHDGELEMALSRALLSWERVYDTSELVTHRSTPAQYLEQCHPTLVPGVNQ